MLSFIIIIVILIIIIIVLSIKYNTKKCPIPSQSQCDDTFPSSQLNFENCSREFPTTKDQCDKFITRENCGNKYNGPSADNCKNFINKESCDSHITAGNCSKFITKPNCDKFITEENCKDKYEEPSASSCYKYIDKDTCNFLITKTNCDKFITADNCYDKVPSIGVKPINLANCDSFITADNCYKKPIGVLPLTVSTCDKYITPESCYDKEFVNYSSIHLGNAVNSSDPFWNKTCDNVCSGVQQKCESGYGGDTPDKRNTTIECNVKKKYMKCLCGPPTTTHSPTTTV